MRGLLGLILALYAGCANAHVQPVPFSDVGSLNDVTHQAAFFMPQTYLPSAPARTQVTITSAPYNATCNGVADDTAAFLAFKAAFQGAAPVQLNLPGNCTYIPTGGQGIFLFKGIADLIVAGNGTATSSIINASGGAQPMLFGGSGQVQDNAHSLRTNDANAGDSCVIAKTTPAVTVSAVGPNIAPTSTFTASASGTTLTVTAVSSGTIAAGAVFTNVNSSTNFFATIQPYGTAGTTGVGGTGTYALSNTNTFGSQTVTTVPASYTASVDASGVMTVTAIADGTLVVGQSVFSIGSEIGGTGVSPRGPSTIKSQLTGAAGSTGTYQLDNAPSTAISSKAFISQAQIRVTLNSTTGLSTGDTLYLSGLTGTGQLPTRMNGLKWIKVINGTQIDLFQVVFDGAYTSGGTGGGDRTSLTPTGSKVMMSGYVLQSYWGAPYGYPSNNHWFEYKTVASTNSGTHQICFTTPLANSYKATWPQYNTGSQFEVDPGGPATLYAIDSTWEMTAVFKDFTIDNTAFQTTAAGRSMTFNNVGMTGVHCVIPTQNETHTWINVAATLCSIETDKLVGVWNITGGSLQKVTVQSSSMNEINVDGTAIGNSWVGSPKKLTLNNVSPTCGSCSGGASAIQVGTAAYGASDETICTNCTVPSANTFVAVAGPVQDALSSAQPWSMSGGIITIPNAYSWNGCCQASELQVRGMVPGHYVTWNGVGGGGTVAQVGRVFKVVDMTQDVDNTYVTTNEAGGFPTGAWTTNGLRVNAHPAPKLTTTNMAGNDTAIIYNGCPAQSPMYSCQNYTYTGGAAGATSGFSPILWGVLDTFTVANNVPYTGAGGLGWNLSRFNNWAVLKTDLTQVNYGSSAPNGQFSINTKLPSSCGSCTRTLTTSGATNTQVGDTLSAPPSGAYFGGSANSGPAFSANTPSDSPQVTVTLRTNQNLP